ncbi:MAG: HAMP domain-containing sensor histidine kinase [Spirochaetales bacterium]|nr:HAMP domain-containing sensor histidine kinase [Spirochaetales bacterium]
MNVKLPTGKQILIPAMILAVAAMGLLFFLQIRWMNNSLQIQNMRYRRGVSDAMNHVARGIIEKLGTERFDPNNPDEFLRELPEEAPDGELIKALHPLKEFRDQGRITFSDPLRKETYLIIGERDNPYVLVLDSAVLYEKIFPDVLAAYSDEYSYRISYGREKLSDILRARKDNSPGDGDKSLIKAYLPLIIDLTDEKQQMDNLLFNPGDLMDYRERGYGIRGLEEGQSELYMYTLEIDLNDGRGSEEFETRLKRTNLALLFLLSLILVSIFLLLLRLYRREERQRKVEQTFVASVSHELRTPISVIKTASDNLFRGIISEGERVKSYGQVIGNEADRLSRLVEGILYYSRMEGSGHNSVQRERVNPGNLTGDILERLKLTMGEQSFDTELKGAPESVSLDRESYRLILDNLVTNGLLHGDNSSLRLRLESDFPSHWRLVVEDEGPGLPRGEQKHIFDPFVRGKRSESEQLRGSGLGLFLVKRAAEAMGGRVLLESPYEFPAGVERKGCRFTVILPIEEEDGHGPHTAD